MKNEKVLNTIEEAIEDFRQGKIVIVVDDEDRENEGDFIIAAEKVTPEIVNFMLKNGRGVLCAPLSEERRAQLELNMMEPNNTSLLGTPFTVTVDLLGEGALRAFRSTTARRPCGHWPTRRPNPPTWGVRGTSTRSEPVRKAFCAVRDIPKPPWTWLDWPDCNPPEH